MAQQKGKARDKVAESFGVNSAPTTVAPYTSTAPTKKYPGKHTPRLALVLRLLHNVKK